MYLYYYDCENRLTDINDTGDNPRTSYKYDYQGRRIARTVYSTLLRKFIYGPSSDEPICMIAVSGGTETIYYYHFDGLGSVVALSDMNSMIVEQYSYNVFGKPNTTNNVNNPYLFTARRYDPEATIKLKGCYTASGSGSIGKAFKMMLPDAKVMGYTGVAKVNFYLGLGFADWQSESKWVEGQLDKKGCE
jgi:YD repeat-containing protein